MKKMSKIIFPIIFVACLVVSAVAILLVSTFETLDFTLSKIIFLSLIALILSFAFSILISKSVAKKIAEPLNEIDLSTDEEFRVYEELTPFYNKIKVHF